MNRPRPNTVDPQTSDFSPAVFVFSKPNGKHLALAGQHGGGHCNGKGCIRIALNTSGSPSEASTPPVPGPLSGPAS